MPLSNEQQKMMANLLKLDGAVVHDAQDVFSSGVQSPSPSFNYLFGNTWLLPQGYGCLLGGLPKGGKSLLVNSMFGQMHQDDPDSVVIKFDTEMREKAQMTPAQLRLWGIDPSRYICFSTNLPEQIFDRIEEEIPKMVQAGIKVRAVAIDSVNDILGRRAINADSVMQQQIGDKALTLGEGFSRIKGILRNCNVSLILTCQARAEMDQQEIQRGHKIKLAVPFAVKHMAEYFISIERLQTKAGKTDLLGNEFKDDTKVDLTGQNKGEGEELGHRIRATMVDSSLSAPGRIAIFTMSHDRGIINTHEEVFLLGVGLRVVNSGGGGNYSINAHGALDDKLKPYVADGRTWRGKESFLAAIRDNKDLYDGILRTCKRLDIDRKNGIEYGADGKAILSDTSNPNVDIGV